MQRIQLLFLIILSLLLVSCSTTKPIKSGQVYNNPKGAFSVPAPISSIGTYADSEYEVIFYDDYGSLYKVEYGDLPEHVIQGFSEYPLAEQIKLFNERVLVAGVFERVNGRVVHEEWMPSIKASYLVLLLKNGSSYYVNNHRVDAYRAFIVFRHNDRIFTLHGQHGFLDLSLGRNKLSETEEVNKLKDKMINFYNTISIP